MRGGVRGVVCVCVLLSFSESLFVEHYTCIQIQFHSLVAGYFSKTVLTKTTFRPCMSCCNIPIFLTARLSL